MSKPKNRVLCPDCGRQKMLFETEKKAQLFIEYNWQELTNNKEQLRVYYCPSCCGYHISSHKHKKSYDNRTDKLIQAYYRDKEKNTLTKETRKQLKLEKATADSEILYNEWKKLNLEDNRDNRKMFKNLHKDFSGFAWQLFMIKLKQENI